MKGRGQGREYDRQMVHGWNCSRGVGRMGNHLGNAVYMGKGKGAWRMKPVPLSVRANIVWTCAERIRAEERGPEGTNWGQMLDKKSMLENMKHDPNPRIQKIAYDVPGCVSEPEPGMVA